MFSTRDYFNTTSNRKVYDEGLRSYMLKMYNLMAAALVLTGICATAVMTIEPLQDLMFNVSSGRMGLTGFGTIISFAPLGIAMYFFMGYGSLSVDKAQILFWVYSALTGMSLSGLGLVYTGESIAKTFFITASVFAGMSIYGYSTKKDLTSFGSFLVMGVMGLVIASLANFFFQSPAVHFALSVMGVLIFTGMIAWDTQRLKSYYYQVGGGTEGQKMAVMGAFTLYLDFINLFLYMLRFLGDRKN
jgi:FtsH-binding integral membrane protein